MSAHSKRGHVELSPSGAHRWMACPGSIQLSRTLPPAPASAAAEEGTAAHELAEQAVKRGLKTNQADAVTWLKQQEGRELSGGVVVTSDMVDAVRVYVRYVVPLARDAHQVWLERRVLLADDVDPPPAPMGGTADCILRFGHMLHIIDFKYGRGVVVEVENNPQLLYYAAAAIDSVKSEISRVATTIIQPRIEHVDGPIRTESYVFDEIEAFRRKLLAAARVALGDDPPLNAGEQCRWCPAKAICPALQKQTLAVAQAEFGTDLVPIQRMPSLEEAAAVLRRLEGVGDYIGVLKQGIMRALAAGHPVPGYKLVAKRPTRQWTDEGEARTYFRDNMLDGRVVDEVLRSPAQVEKVLGKKALPRHLVVRVSTGVVLADASDPRPAVNSGLDAADDFPALEEAAALDN